MLTQFYKEMQAWVDAGLPEVSFFSKSFGLCTNLRIHVWETRGITPPLEVNERLFQLLEEMHKQFLDEHLDPAYPFNVSASEFVCETDQDTKYSNPKRLDWIKSHANPVL